MLLNIYTRVIIDIHCVIILDNAYRVSLTPDNPLSVKSFPIVNIIDQMSDCGDVAKYLK